MSPVGLSGARVVKALVLVVVFVASFAVPVWATNTHTVSGYYHGCGDCSGAYNYYIHPFTEAAGNYNWKRGQAYYLGSPLGGLSGDCNCPHAHMSWDTNPTAECKYSSYNAASGPSLNGHWHYFHDYGGYC